MNVSLRFYQVCFYVLTTIIISSCGAGLSPLDISYIEYLQQKSDIDKASNIESSENNNGQQFGNRGETPGGPYSKESSAIYTVNEKPYSNIKNELSQDSLPNYSTYCSNGTGNCLKEFVCGTGICLKNIVIGSCAMSTCNGEELSHLILESYMKSATFTITKKNSNELATTVTLNQTSKKPLFSNKRRVKMNFLETGALYDISVYAESKSGEFMTSTIQNMKFSEKQFFNNL